MGSEEHERREAKSEKQLGRRATRASVWTMGSMGSMSVMRFGSQLVLAYLLLPEYFGIIAILRTFLVGIEQVSQVGFRDSIVYHRRGEEPAFLNTAWTVQIVRGFALWGLACAIAKPVADFYSARNPDAAILLWLLPVAGLESINNGLQSIHIFVAERRLNLRVPVMLEWIALAVSILVAGVWAFIEPTVWALAVGPVAGGAVKTVLSHVWLRHEHSRLQWERETVRDLVTFGKWVYLGALTAFVSQQFHVLFLGKVAALAVTGVYQVAWNFVVQSSKPLTMLSNKVMIPFFAEYGRKGKDLPVMRTFDKFLPACLVVCVGAFLICPALFGYFYPRTYVDGGYMGRLLAIVVWFMILQHVPRSALLSLGHSRGVFWMTLLNALITVGGVVLGFRIGAVRGLILGNALGNLVGCLVGAWMCRAQGVRVGLPMVYYSMLFAALTTSGLTLSFGLQAPWLDLSPRVASLISTTVLMIPAFALLWKRTLRGALESRRLAQAEDAEALKHAVENSGVAG